MAAIHAFKPKAAGPLPANSGYDFCASTPIDIYNVQEVSWTGRAGGYVLSPLTVRT
jgi:hypothetical protein